MPLHLDDVRWALLVAKRDGAAGRRTAPIVDTPTARSLMDELEALPLPDFLARLQQIRQRHERQDDAG
jgi:hypothetical protein